MGNLFSTRTIYDIMPELIEYKPQFECLKLKSKTLIQFYEIFRKIDDDMSGTVEIIELLSFLGLKSNRFTKRVFSIFDEDGNGTIDFREFVMSLWNYCTLSKSTLVLFAFDLYDKDNRQVLQCNDYRNPLSISLMKNWNYSVNIGEIDVEEIEELVKDLYGSKYEDTPIAMKTVDQIQSIGSGTVDVDSLREFAQTHPALLYPAFVIQNTLQNKVLGMKFWEKYANIRIKLSNGSYLSIGELKELHVRRVEYFKVVSSSMKTKNAYHLYIFQGIVGGDPYIARPVSGIILDVIFQTGTFANRTMNRHGNIQKFSDYPKDPASNTLSWWRHGWKALRLFSSTGSRTPSRPNTKQIAVKSMAHTMPKSNLQVLESSSSSTSDASPLSRFPRQSTSEQITIYNKGQRKSNVSLTSDTPNTLKRGSVSSVGNKRKTLKHGSSSTSQSDVDSPYIARGGEKRMPFQPPKSKNKRNSSATSLPKSITTTKEVNESTMMYQRQYVPSSNRSSINSISNANSAVAPKLSAVKPGGEGAMQTNQGNISPVMATTAASIVLAKRAITESQIKDSVIKSPTTINSVKSSVSSTSIVQPSVSIANRNIVASDSFKVEGGSRKPKTVTFVLDEDIEPSVVADAKSSSNNSNTQWKSAKKGYSYR